MQTTLRIGDPVPRFFPAPPPLFAGETVEIRLAGDFGSPEASCLRLILAAPGGAVLAEARPFMRDVDGGYYVVLRLDTAPVIALFAGGTARTVAAKCVIYDDAAHAVVAHGSVVLCANLAFAMAAAPGSAATAWPSSAVAPPSMPDAPNPPPHDDAPDAYTESVAECLWIPYADHATTGGFRFQ